MHCPNTSSQEWKDLVQQVGEKEAWRSFFKYGEVRPPFVRKTLEKKNISKLSKLFGEDLAKILIKEYSLNEGEKTFYIPTLTELKKELEGSKISTMRIITNALTLNPSLSEDAIKFFLKGIINDSEGTIYVTKGYVTSQSSILNYEQTQNRFEKNYAFVQRLVAKYPSIFKIKDTKNPTTKVVEITPGQPRLFADKDDQKRGGQDKRIQEKYFPTNVQKSSVVVKKIAESNHPLSKLAKQLLKYVEKNDVDIELVDGELETKWAAGTYYTGKNKIQISKDASFRGLGSENTILHEVLHALTTNLSGTTDTEFQRLFQYVKENIKEDLYELTNIDEFLTGIFTNAEFVKKLQALPATGKNYVNAWEELLDYILGLFKIKRGTTLYDDAFALATQAIESEYEYNEYLQSEEYTKSRDAFLETLSTQDTDSRDVSFISFEEDDTILASPQSGQQVLKSIRTKSTEEIAETIDKSLIRTQNDIKYTNYIQSLTLDAIGEISPNKVLKTSMDSAFQTAKGKFETSLRNANDFIQLVKSPEIFNALKEKDAVKLEGLINRFNLQGARSYEEVVKAIEQYESIVNNFDRYKEFVRAELTRKGIREVKGKIAEVQSEDVTNQEQDNTEDNLIAQEEIGERFDKGINEVNPRDTASIKVKALVNNIQIPGQFELGIPLYADPSDVFADLLNAGVDMQLSGYTEDAGKYEAFVASLQKNVEARPYLAEVINKLENFKKAGKWDTVNQVLTFASKAFANETLLLYKTQKSGTEITGITEIKTVSINRESVEEQVSKAWYAQQMNSDFFIKSATGDRFPNPEKVDQLEQIIEDGKTLQGADKIKKFQEFFKVMGINLTDTQMAFIAPRLPGELKKTKNFDGLFIKNGMLYNIYMGYRNNLENAFLGQYGLQNEKSSVGKLAKLYYQVNPGLINVPSGKDAAGKSKFSNIQTNFVEIKKRQWKLGDSSIVMNSALAQPNKEFWTDVKNNLKTFSLDYFNGMREQESGVDGKVRKNLTANEQTRAMFMKHQENMNTGTYVVFTLSDKTGSIEVKQSKEFFVDDAKIPVGKGTDFILDEKGDIEYTDSLKEKVYNTFVEPEVSRILAAMKHSKDVNVENFDISSQLFYILPMLNANSLLDGFRRDLYSNSLSLEELSKNHAKAVGAVVLNEFMLSTEQQINDYLQKGIIKNNNGVYTFPSFKNGYKATDYVNRFRQTGAKGRNLAKLMVMDMKLNYMNAQVKTLQFLRFDPMVAFKMPKGIDKKAFSLYTANEKLKIVGTTWDEFSKRAAALIAPGGQGSWSWETSTGEKYFSKDYRTVTVADVSVKINGTKSDIADAEEFTTMQEHIDYLMSEGKLDLKIWESINEKIKKAGKGGFYKLSGEEMKSVFTPLKPVHVNDVNEGENTGLNRIDYVKSSRYPLIPEHEAGTERDKLRQWMEKNDIQSVNFASGKKLGRPSEVLALFDDNQNFVEPTEELLNKGIQVLSRDGLRTQQEIPHQKDEIATVSQMNRTLFDGLLQSTFDVPGLGKVKGGELKSIKEKVRSRLFEMKSAELDEELGDLNLSHRGLYNMLKKVILEDTSGSYGENDLRAIELDPVTGKFMFPLEANFKIKKIQGLINSMISKNVMLKMNGSSFVQVSAVGSKYSFSSLSSGVKSGIIWTDSFAATFKNGPAKLNYISKKNGKVAPAQVVVSQYLKDSNGKLIDLNDFIIEENGVKILDTSKMDPSLLQLVASRIPNQSHVSMLPIEVVGFLPSYMEDTIIVPDGITGQMGSDFDVDKLYAYKSKTEAVTDDEGNIIGYKPTKYSVNSVSDIDNLSEEQLKEFYKDIHWAVLTNPDTFDKITKSVDMDETKAKVALREKQLEKYKVQGDPTINMPLDFNTSINRFNDNRSGKDGVSIFASLISAQADFQDKVLQLGKEVEGEDTPDPIYIKIGNEVKSFEFVGQTGESESFLYEPGKVPKRSVSDNLNIPFTESVDNAKNQYLREFNWDKKAMSSVGILSMLTTAKKEGIPINFAMDLMSQDSIYTLFDLIDQSQDSFGDFDPNALSNGVIKLTTDYIAKIDTGEYLKGGKTAIEHLTDGNRKKNNPLSAEKLSNMWLVGKMLKEEGVIFGAKIREDAEAKGENLEGVQDEKLLKLSKDLGYKNVNDLLLDYYTTQYDSLELFSKLDGIGTELMTIIGAVYPYTKGIGQDVFTTKQKLNQLNKLSNSTVFLGIDKIAGDVSKNDNGILSIDPEGEIGNNIKYSLIKAQEIYQNLFPISTGKHLENIVDTMLADRGLTKDDIGKQSYYNIYNDVFNGIKSYMFTIPDLELFGESLQSVRKRLINGDSSLGKSILDLQQIPQFAKNGFLKNIEISEQYNGDAFTISFKAPFGTDLDEKAILSGFYELAVSENETVREIARELALYPFATGDAGNIGRFIPIDYYMKDTDFKNAMSSMNDIYSQNMGVEGIRIIKDQIVQNNAEAYAKKFTFLTAQTDQGSNDNIFKRNFRKIINSGSLENVKTFTIKLGDFESDPKAAGIIKSLTISKLTDAERRYASDNKFSMEFKYPAYLLLNDKVISEFGDVKDSSVNFLYKRTSDAINNEGTATYERINILGYKNIKEYEFGNASLKSAIKENQTDVSSEEFAGGEEFSEPMEGDYVSEGEDSAFGMTFGNEEFEDFSPFTEEQTSKEGIVYKNGTNYLTEDGKIVGQMTPEGMVPIQSTSTEEQPAQLSNAPKVKYSDLKAGDVINVTSKNDPSVIGTLTVSYIESSDFIRFDMNFSNGFQEDSIGYSEKEFNELFATTQSSTSVKTGIEINSKETGLGNSLTNVHYAKNGKSTFDIIPTDKTLSNPITGRGLKGKSALETWGNSVEAWYQSNNAQTKGVPEGVEGDAYDMKLMVGLITDKLNQYPNLVQQINASGGIEFLNKSTHTMGNGRWSSNNPKNMFMNALKQAYQTVAPTTQSSTSVEPEVVIPSVEISKINYTKETPNDKSKGFFFTENLQAYLATRNRIKEVTELPRQNKNIKLDVTAVNNQAGIRFDRNNGRPNENAFAIISKKYQQNDNSDSFVAEEGQFKDTDSDFELFKKYNSEAINEAIAYNKPLVVAEAGIATGKSALPLRFAEWLNNELKNKLGIQGDIKENTTEGYNGYGIFNLSKQSNVSIEELEELEDKEPMRVAYGAQTFILEGSPQDGYIIWYQEKGSKGKLVNDPNLANKVALTHDAEIYPENVVTLTDMPNSPRYYVDLTGEILSLQDSTFGKQITGDDVVRRVNKALAQQVEVETDVVEITPATDQNIDERTGKMLVIPMGGSKATNMVIFETDKAKFLMNDGQQEAYDFIKGNVERLLKERKSIRPEDLEKTVSFNDPLTEKFSGVIPKAMWDNMIGLAGRGGVGKTTVIRAIMNSLDSGNKYRSTSVMYLAPSHTAATVLQESLGLDSEKANDGTVNTIQSSVRRNQINKSTGNLELMSEEEYINGLKFKPAFSAPDIIIVDESSMVTTEAIKDMLVRTKTDLEIGKTAKMPIFIFMGDYRQLGPFGEMQNKDVNKGIISSTLLLNKEKTKELTQVMRSDNENLHKMYDAIGNEIIDNINRTKNGQQPKQLSFDAYDRLTNKSSENILVVDNVVGVIDDYTDFLKSNNNPYGMFWVHYNQVENANTMTLADKIRKSYFQKIGRNIDSSAHRKFSNQDYIEFTNTLEMAGSRFMYTPSTPEVKKLLDDRKIDNVDGEYAIVGGMIKPRSRYKVMDIVKDVQSLHNVAPSLSGVVPNISVDVENVLLYNRQNKLRGYSKILGLSVDLGKYNSRSRQQEGITIKDKQTGEVLAKFDMFYGAFKTVQDSLKGLNDTTQMPFVPSYIGSSHTAQGNSIRNVIVGDANIKQNRANPKINQDDIFSSMYVALTRTSGTLTIIKPQGANIIHNEEVYQGAITDDGKTTVKPVSSIKPASFEPVTSINDDVSEYGSNETFDPLELLLQNSTDEYIDNFINPLFKGETTVTNFKAFIDRFYKETTAFNKSVIGAIVKSGIVTPFKIVIDNKLKDPGQYDNFTKTLTINPKLAIGDTTDLDGIKQKIHEVIMHEIMHHMTADFLNAKPETLSAEQRKWVESLTNLFDTVQQRMLNDPNHKDALQKAMDQVNNNGFLSASDKSLYYGLTNVHDFVSMLMTDQGFQDFMNNTTFDGQKSFFDKFVDLINNLLKVLGINVKDDSVLKEGITNIIGLIQSRNVSDANSIQKSILAKDARETNISDNFNDIIKFLNIKTNC